MRPALVLVLGSLLAFGCARRSEPVAAVGVARRAVDPVAVYLTDARAALARAEAESPADATRTLTAFAALPAPTSMPPGEAAFVRVTLDRELSLQALSAGNAADAVIAIERALATAEAVAPRDPARDAALLLVAETVYRRAGRDAAADWAHREAAILLR